jgi:DNA-binding MarR family transcriptional regulator
MRNLGQVLYDVTRLMKAEFERGAKSRKMTFQQWRVLGSLAKSDGLTQKALCAATEASPMTVSETLDRLESMGLVRREPDPSDSRAKLVWITPQAAPIVADMRRVSDAVYDKAMAGMPQKDREALIATLERIAANLAPAGPDKKE